MKKKVAKRKGHEMSGPVEKVHKLKEEKDIIVLIQNIFQVIYNVAFTSKFAVFYYSQDNIVYGKCNFKQNCFLKSLTVWQLLYERKSIDLRAKNILIVTNVFGIIFFGV